MSRPSQATAALRADANTAGAAGAPYLCGFMDAAALTHSWPYEEINDFEQELAQAGIARPRWPG